MKDNFKLFCFLVKGSKTLEDVRDFFKETDSTFTIHVVEQRFVVGRGSDYFRSYKGEINYIDSNHVIKKRIFRILNTINKYIPNTAELIQKCFNYTTPLSIIDIISSLSKIFSVNEHQAAGPEVIDPIIIQEGEILPKYVNQMIALHKYSILRPTIIILLQDNDFDRASKLLSQCPHNTNIKMIRNSGEIFIYKVINCGVDSPDEFLEAFSTQCFSTCSRTKRKILYNEEWAENSIVKLYSPMILQMRTSLLFDDKTLVKKDLNNLINNINLENTDNEFDNKLLRSFECILKLFRLFCNDGGIKDINDSFSIAKELDNEILLAHVYRNAHFLEQFTLDQKMSLMDKAYDIFSANKMEDHAIYCKNNKLVRQFDTDKVSVKDFLSLQEEAVYNVPGLVGMPHILMNVGAALMTNGYPDEAIFYFNKGLDYAFRPERCVQKVALLSNRAIAKSYCFNTIEENELKKIMNLIFDNKEVLNLPFLSARYALNIIAVALNQHVDLGKELLNTYPVCDLINKSFATNLLGSGQMLLQMNLLEKKYSGKLHLTEKCKAPTKIIEAKGVRKDFIIKSTYNPCSFSTWF